MNISEKRADGPLLPFINPGTHTTTPDTSTTTTTSTSTDKVVSALQSFNRVVEGINRSLDSSSIFLLMATQIICCGIIVGYTATLGYFFVTERRARTPEVALDVICSVVPFVAFGVSARILEMAVMFVRFIDRRGCIRLEAYHAAEARRHGLVEVQN